MAIRIIGQQMMQHHLSYFVKDDQFKTKIYWTTASSFQTANNDLLQIQ